MHDFEKVLVKPHIEPLDLHTIRIRRNLIVAAVVVILYCSGIAEIDIKNSSLLGVKFTSFDTNYLKYGMVSILLYLMLHFIWAMYDHVTQNLFRLTGVVIPTIRQGVRFSSPTNLEPNTNNQMQSTLYSWWAIQRTLTIEQNKKFSENIVELENIDSTTLGVVKNSLERIEGYASYLDEGLKRIDKGFWSYQRSQLLRWLLLDFSLPVFLSFLAFVMLIMTW